MIIYDILFIYSSTKCQLLWWTWSLFSLCLYLCLRCCVFVLLPFFRWIKIYILSGLGLRRSPWLRLRPPLNSGAYVRYAYTSHARILAGSTPQTQNITPSGHLSPRKSPSYDICSVPDHKPNLMVNPNRNPGTRFTKYLTIILRYCQSYDRLTTNV